VSSILLKRLFGSFGRPHRLHVVSGILRPKQGVAAPEFASSCDLKTEIQDMVDQVLVDRMKTALEVTHNGKAKYLYAIPVHEKNSGETVWYGRVYLFAFESQGVTKNVYAWFQEATEGPRKLFTVFREGGVDSPNAAVRTALGLNH
jgi:hypothetical protein